MKRLGVWALGLPALGVAAVTAASIFSPYGSRPDFPFPLILESVEIAAPCPVVQGYLGDSNNARDWSVYVDHITPLNADEVPDGEQGSIRRSFKNADETGMRWDEYFELVEPNRRRLTVYDVVGSPSTQGELLTEQIFEPREGGRCRLAFTLFLRDDPSLRDELLLRLGGWNVARIFRANITNVKELVEAL